MNWFDPSPPFVPHPLLRGPHHQTVGAAYLWRRVPYRAVRREIDLPDGDRLVAHDDCPPQWQPGERMVLLVHGLGGSHRSGYMARIAAKLNRIGVRAFRLDLRGCGDGRWTARHSVHAGRTDDLRTAAEQLAAWHPDAPLTVVGFSLGASILLKTLGEAAGMPVAVDSAIGVAPPLDLAACCHQIQRGWNRLYDRNFVRALQQVLKQRRRRVPGFVDADHELLANLKTLYEFDAHFTAPLGGYRDVDHYYESASCMAHLATIRLPVRILTSLDDPLVPAVLLERAQFSATTQVTATAAGGHLGYLAARTGTSHKDPDWHWMDWRIVEWVDALPRQHTVAAPSALVAAP